VSVVIVSQIIDNTGIILQLRYLGIVLSAKPWQTRIDLDAPGAKALEHVRFPIIVPDLLGLQSGAAEIGRPKGLIGL
jgi:hypothetical protein